MNSLFRFLQRNSAFLTWLILAVVSIVMLCQGNPYHRSIWMGSANRVSGSVFQSVNAFTSYFGLREANEALLRRMGDMEAENQRLRTMLVQYEDLHNPSIDTIPQYHFEIAHVVGNSIAQAENYITLDKGSLDSVKVNLGVADHNGVVGIVAAVSEHYSLVISLLNPKLRISVKLKNSDSFGSLVWDGESYEYAILSDLPRSVQFTAGDTVVTSGYSGSFPKGLPVGIITETLEREDDNFLVFRVKLFTDFNNLNSVFVIHNDRQDEIQKLENQ